MIDDYRKLRTKDKDRMFEELFELKEQKSVLDKRIKEIEAEYKPDLDGLHHDLFYELDSGKRFSIKCSKRKGSIQPKKLEEDGIDVDKYRGKESTVYTLRLDK